ncbi:MAG: hypothetical protein Q8K78_05425 [Planctomycetaceae bacterium]|jgi:hypothetical protein|nr:hypothetical protein [Planctomycetaceae bacterium]
MVEVFTLVVGLGTLAVFIVAAWFVLREIRRHRDELDVRQRLLDQARPILQSSNCAACGGALSTWDGGLSPLPAGKHAAPAHIKSRIVAEYEARRECLRCGHRFVLWLWSDGDNWGFVEADEI